MRAPLTPEQAWDAHVARYLGTPYHEKLTPTAAETFRAGWAAREGAMRKLVDVLRDGGYCRDCRTGRRFTTDPAGVWVFIESAALFHPGQTWPDEMKAQLRRIGNLAHDALTPPAPEQG